MASNGEEMKTGMQGDLREGPEGRLGGGCSQEFSLARVGKPTRRQRRRMPPDLDYLLALGEARSCLVALADMADDDVQASRFERLLITLDILESDGPPPGPGRRVASRSWVDWKGLWHGSWSSAPIHCCSGRSWFSPTSR